MQLLGLAWFEHIEHTQRLALVERQQRNEGTALKSRLENCGGRSGQAGADGPACICAHALLQGPGAPPYALLSLDWLELVPVLSSSYRVSCPAQAVAQPGMTHSAFQQPGHHQPCTCTHCEHEPQQQHVHGVQAA